MVRIYGTLGPACRDEHVLREMFRLGMTGMRINTSHITVAEAEPDIRRIQAAAAACGIMPDILIDMQGPELRISLSGGPMDLREGDVIPMTGWAITLPDVAADALEPGTDILLDDGKLLLTMQDGTHAVVRRGGTLRSGKSIALPGISLPVPAMTEQDRINLRDAAGCGVTGVMQPFVRSADDLMQVRSAINAAGGHHIALLAKIENMDGVAHLADFFGLADEIVIARGDLGNAMPLWELPVVQADISARCRTAGMPFMVVTQMLASMERSAVPTRAEVSDIYHAVRSGAASVMVTGETAVGAYPVEVIRHLANTVRCAERGSSLFSE